MVLIFSGKCGTKFWKKAIESPKNGDFSLLILLCCWGYTVNCDNIYPSFAAYSIFSASKGYSLDKPVITTLGRIFFYTLPAVLLDIFFRCLTTLSIYAQQSCQR
jgi:hypothetical protein